MKYKGILCYVRPQEKKEIEFAMQDIPLEFVDSLSEFEKKITKNSYLIVSLFFSNKDLKNLADKFPNNTFNFYRLKANEEQTSEQTSLMGYNNITDCQYSADELRNNYLGIIDDLWKYRLFENPTVIYC
jgi:hypothetical protein